MVKKYDNPWNLTPRQAATMDAVCTHGCQKLAADDLGISIKTVEVHCHDAGVRMRARTHIGKYLEWDRWMRRRGGAA